MKAQPGSRKFNVLVSIGLKGAGLHRLFSTSTLEVTGHAHHFLIGTSRSAGPYLLDCNVRKYLAGAGRLPFVLKLC